MGSFIRYILIIYAIFFLKVFVSHAEANECFTLLATNTTNIQKVDTNLSKVMQKIHLLDTSLEQAVKSIENGKLEDIYMLIKEKAWSVLPHGMINWKSGFSIPELMKKRWVGNFSHRYHIEKLKENELVIFYANYLQSVYIQLSAMIKEAKIAELNLGPVHPKVKKLLITTLEKYWVSDLRNSSLNPELAQEVLYDDSYKSLNWAAFVTIFADLIEGEISTERFEQVTQNITLTNFELNLIKNVYLNMGQKPPVDTCCKNKPGCVFCPNNLGFVNQDDGPPIPKLKF